MPPRYLFPCPDCDHQFELVTTQAGQELACPQCNTTTEAPKLGVLKQLAPVSGPNRENKRSGKKSNNNILATLGLALAIFCGLGGLGLYQYGSGMVNEFDIESDLEVFNGEIDKLSPNDISLFYSSIQTEEGLGEWSEQDIVRYNRQGAILKNASYGLLGVAVLGLLMFLGSLFSKKR